MVTSAKILIAEDDKDIRELLKLYLVSEGYQVICAENGEIALAMAEKESPDIAILDIMMPKTDGLEVVRLLRERASDIPILIASARGQDGDKILGLNMGADDYISKPFNPLEVVARVKALLRRAGSHDGKKISCGDLEVDTEGYSLIKRGEQIYLTPTEYKILIKLMGNPGRIFTKVQLYESINGEYFENDDNTMMVHISRLRDKIEDDPKNPKYITTVRGVGYKFEKK